MTSLNTAMCRSDQVRFLGSRSLREAFHQALQAQHAQAEHSPPPLPHPVLAASSRLPHRAGLPRWPPSSTASTSSAAQHFQFSPCAALTHPPLLRCPSFLICLSHQSPRLLHTPRSPAKVCPGYTSLAARLGSSWASRESQRPRCSTLHDDVIPACPRLLSHRLHTCLALQPDDLRWFSKCPFNPAADSTRPAKLSSWVSLPKQTLRCPSGAYTVLSVLASCALRSPWCAPLHCVLRNIETA